MFILKAPDKLPLAANMLIIDALVSLAPLQFGPYVIDLSAHLSSNVKALRDSLLLPLFIHVMSSCAQFFTPGVEPVFCFDRCSCACILACPMSDILAWRTWSGGHARCVSWAVNCLSANLEEHLGPEYIDHISTSIFLKGFLQALGPDLRLVAQKWSESKAARSAAPRF